MNNILLNLESIGLHIAMIGLLARFIKYGLSINYIYLYAVHFNRAQIAEFRTSD